MHEFCWYELRTTDLAAARDFYAEAIGLAWDADLRLQAGAAGPMHGELAILPARAAALGAPAHWLGHISVADVEDAVGRFVALGATRLGPAQARADGVDVAVLRDPLGAVVAVTSRAPTTSLAWCELHTRDHARAAKIYGDMFGWVATEARDLGPELGAYQEFARRTGRSGVGAFTDFARRPGIHTHWLFYFAVDDIDAVAARVRARGGRVLHGPVVVAGGARVMGCEDPQGAAFAVRQAAR